VLWLAAIALAVGSATLFVAYRGQVRFLAATAQRISGGVKLSDEQLLGRFTQFAHDQIRNPTFAQLPSGVRLYYLLNPTHPGPGDVLRWGSDYRGGCGSHTRVVVALLQASGVRCRPLFLLDDRGRSIHTVVQALIGGRWVVSDALYGIVYRTRDGRLATAADLAADTANFWAQTRSHGDYSREFDYDRVSIMNWQKLPVVLPALGAALELVAGRERVAEIARPAIWMWPRATASLACALLALGLATLALHPRVWRSGSS
jgi:hypothetical protein